VTGAPGSTSLRPMILTGIRSLLESTCPAPRGPVQTAAAIYR
jgi:hypothetical protein